jgi:hypothetical protein
MTRHDHDDRDARGAGDDTQRGELDALLRQWHDDSARRADAAWAGVERAIGAAGGQDAKGAPPRTATARPSGAASARASIGAVLVSLARRPALRAAAAIVLLVLVATVLVPRTGAPALGETILVPNAGRLEALDEEGNLVGPCALKHTDVDVEVSGPFARVTVRQDYHNPYQRKIEARYTFPLSHRGAVDRMTMVVGDRVVVGEVREREEAQRIYRAAREQGYVASLLEQERPNIFTQSVANIEPGAEISIEISYVELLAAVEGEFRFQFPMTVAPRYIPGYTLPREDPRAVPAGFEPREGVTLLGPAKITAIAPQGETAETETASDDNETITAKSLTRRLHAARPLRIRRSSSAEVSALTAGPTHMFEVEYADGAKERGRIFAGGLCELNGRWCVLAPAAGSDPVTGFSGDTDEVPDASRITPMPVLPGERAGHDISVAVTIDTGGPAITGWQSELHRLAERRDAAEEPRPGHLHVALESAKEIPNRDFLLRWTIDESEIQEAHFVHRSAPREDVPGRAVGAPVPDPHGYFTLMLRPPARVADEDVRGRELIFVMDSSGSMEGFPIEKAQAVMKRAIEAMRPQDLFNVITFNNETDCLWTEPRPANEVNRAAAIAYVLGRQGGGGTEMKKAVLAALQPSAGVKSAPLTPDELANTPADGRTVAVLCPLSKVHAGEDGTIWLQVLDDVRLRLSADVLAELLALPVRDDRTVELRGTWALAGGQRVLAVDTIGDGTGAGRLRCVYFLSDGEVGNDDAIVEAVRTHTRQTRVFTMAIGNGPNRSLLDAMAKAGRGAADYITLEGDADAAVATFVRRLATPVLTDIELVFDGVEVVDVIPALDEIVDLYDEKPLVVHGRYAKPGAGTLTVRGITGAGPYERVIDLELPAVDASNDVIATHWARAKVDEHMARGDRDAVIALGIAHHLLTQYTSFVAVEKSRVTVGGRPMLVAVPIEMPEGQSWEGTFGRQRRLQLHALDDARTEDLAALAQAIGARRERAIELQAAAMAVEGEQLIERAEKLLDRQDYDGAQQAALSAKIVAERGRSQLDTDEFRKLTGEADVKLAAIDKARESDPIELKRELAAAEQRDGVIRDTRDITQRLERIRELQIELRYEEARDVVDEILFLDEHNTAGIVLRDALANAAPTRSRFNLSEGGVTRGLEAAGVAGEVNGAFQPIIDSERDVARLSADQYFAGGQVTAGEPIAAYKVVAGVPITTGTPADRPHQRAFFANEAGAERHGYRSVSADQTLAFGAQLREAAVDQFYYTPDLLGDTPQLGAMFQIDGKQPVYPEDWPQLSLMRFGDTGEQEAEDDLAVGRLIEDAKVPVYFTDNTLQEIVSFFTQVTGVPFFADWKSLETIGVRPESTVSLEIEEAAIGTALDRVLEQLGDEVDRPRYVVSGGTVVITTDAAARAAAQRSPVHGLAATLGLGGDVGLEGADVLLALAARMVAQDAFDGARVVVTDVLAKTPAHADAVAMRDALDDETIDDAARKTRIAEIADRVRQRLDAQIQAWERTAHLKQVLDEKLWPVALEPADHAENVWVSILLAERGDDAIAALENAGVEILGRAKTHPIVIGAVAPAQLGDVAMREGVRRIEPFVSSPGR